LVSETLYDFAQRSKLTGQLACNKPVLSTVEGHSALHRTNATCGTITNGHCAGVNYFAICFNFSVSAPVGL